MTEEQYLDERIGGLLEQFEEQRTEIKKMITELEIIKGKIDQLIPTNLDKRYFRFFEDKVKAVTGFFNILLEMRKEITKNLKDEIELRRKVTLEDDFDPETDLDLRKIANSISEMNDKKQEMKEKIEVIKKKDDSVNDDPVIEEIEIPGVNTPLSG